MSTQTNILSITNRQQQQQQQQHCGTIIQPTKIYEKIPVHNVFFSFFFKEFPFRNEKKSYKQPEPTDAQIDRPKKLVCPLFFTRCCCCTYCCLLLLLLSLVVVVLLLSLLLLLLLLSCCISRGNRLKFGAGARAKSTFYNATCNNFL